MPIAETGHAETNTTPRGKFGQGVPLLALTLCAAAIATGCSSSSEKKTQAAGPSAGIPVSVAQVVVKTVPLALRVIGNVEAYSTVALKSQVAARVESVHFKQGQDVHKGDLLFLLDKRPFETDLQASQAAYERDIAKAKDAEIQAQRYQQLQEQGVVSKSAYDDLAYAATASQAQVRADQAAIEFAKLRIEYCTIYSPIDGRTGSVLVYPGNLVKENDVPVLVVINQFQPIYVNFAVPEQSLGDIKKYMALRPLTVQAEIPQQGGAIETGVLSFVDNAVDAGTGTIHLKGTFENSQRRLWPGQFVNVILQLTEEPNRLVIPSQAVQTGQSGAYVYVVKGDNTVEARPVTMVRTAGNDAVIEKGLTPGENVVTDGQLRLAPGTKVEIRAGR
jgi:membrane fusion protein, multidrug efflux system